MREHIKQVIEAGGTVSFPLRASRDGLDREAKVYGHRSSDDKDHTPTYYVEVEEFKDAGEAADEYIRRTITRANIGLAYAYWLARGTDLEDLPEEQADSLVESFKADIFHRLYPFAEEQS
jgi:hypothetical protein